MPAETVDQHWVKMFANDVFTLAQQRDSKLRAAVDTEPDITGTQKSINRMGSVRFAAHTTRYAPVTFTNVPHDVRWLNIADYSLFTPIDEIDKIRMKYDPTNEYTQRHSYAGGVLIDQVVIAAADATVTTGADQSGTETFDTSGFQVAVDYKEDGTTADSNLTVGKIRRAQTILDTNFAPQEGRYLILSPNNRQSLLRDSTVTSSDYNTVKALVNGEINQWLGFNFILSNLLTLGTGNVRDVYAWQKGAIRLGFAGSGMSTDGPEKRPDLVRTWQIGSTMHLGAVRVEQARIVKIKADEDL